MSVRALRYEVEGWGVGELWLREGLLVGHAFTFELPAPSRSLARVGAPGPVPARPARAGGHGAASSPPAWGEHGPPRATVARDLQRERNGSAARARRSSSDDDPADAVAHLVARVRAFLAGDDVELADIALDLRACTAFQEEVIGALRAVPRGEVVTYGELAALAGHPGAQRAVGTVCARNPFVLVVPCHRVVAATGIGGYGEAGADVKRRLLALEGVVL